MGKSALLRAVPTLGKLRVGTRNLSSGRRRAGPVGFAHPTHQGLAPEKSRGSWHAATRMFRVVAGVLRLLPTKRGSPAVMTAPTAAISPLRIAESASLCVPPSGASIRTMSAALPAASAPLSRRYTPALLPVAAAMAISGATPARLDRCAIV